MLETIQVSVFIPDVTAERLYRAWLDSREHSAFTGSSAQVEPWAGGRFTAWDGYILGQTLELEPFRRILQAWRTTEFPPRSADSRLEIQLQDVEGGVYITLNHSQIPAGQGERYRQGWVDFYFEPLRLYYSSEVE